jgi:hypothetical protein
LFAFFDMPNFFRASPTRMGSEKKQGLLPNINGPTQKV